MDLRILKQKVARYLQERSCPGGGFCFYRLNEPNPQDTYYALAIADLLQLPCHDERTILYLQALQQADGSYESLTQAFFVLLSLRRLDRQPLHDPTEQIVSYATRLLAIALPANTARPAILHELHQLTALFKAMEIEWPTERKDTVVRLVQSFQQVDGGFGVEGSSLPETAWATVVLRRVGHPPAAINVESFLRSCEHPTFGFTGKPETALFFLEYLHAGLTLCQELRCIPTFPSACLSALLRCQTDTGGFARTHLAIATMDDTFRAIHGLTILQRMGIR